jgi:NADP-dependent 3-hydroxy acid dehydrogenase YdfG
VKINQAVILITGASSGIGAATARAASRAGARVVLIARREERITALADELDDSFAITCDVTDASQVAAAVAAAKERFGRLDVLVNNAGQGLQAYVSDINLDDFRAIIELNLVAPLCVTQAVLPLMRQQGEGCIVNVSSGITFGAIPGSGAYAATKSALEKLTDVTRAELADEGITVARIMPFSTDTDFVSSLRAGADEAAALNASLPISPHLPEDVAAAILDLIRSGKDQVDLVPVQFGGTFTG